MKSFWDRFGIVLGSFWNRFGIVLASFWDRFGIVLGSFWDRFGIVLESFWDRFGIVLGTFWDRFVLNDSIFVEPQWLRRYCRYHYNSRLIDAYLSVPYTAHNTTTRGGAAV